MTAKITIEAEPDLVEAIITAIRPALDIADAGRNNRLALSPDKVRRTIRASLLPEPSGLNPTQVAGLAKQAGAQGVWLIRGAKNACLVYDLDDIPPPNIPGDASANLSIDLAIADAAVLLIARFPASDGGRPGLETR